MTIVPEQIGRLEDWHALSVEIQRHTITAGYYETGAAFTAAEMSLHGEVVDTRFDRTVPNTSVDVEIEFTAEQQNDDEGYECRDEDLPVPDGYDSGASYMGHIRVQLPHPGRPVTDIHVNLFLSLNVFSLLMALKGTRIRLSTVHDSLVSPKVEHNTYIAAFVKRIEFQPMRS